MLSREKQKKVIFLKRSNKYKTEKNTKGQIAGQILIYVLAIIVFGLTLIYGYKAISYFTERGTEISYLQLEQDLKSVIEKVEGDTMGTIKKHVLSVPGSYKDICFVKSYPTFPAGAIAEASQYPLIENHIGSGANDKNVFLAPPGDVSFFVGDIIVTDSSDVELDAACFSLSGSKVTLRLESMGNHVKISKWG